MSNLTIPSLQYGHGVQHQPQGLTQNGRIACIVLCAFSALSCVGTSVLSALAFTGVLILIANPVVLPAFACCALIASIAFGFPLIDTRRETVQEEVEETNNNVSNIQEEVEETNNNVSNIQEEVEETNNNVSNIQEEPKDIKNDKTALQNNNETTENNKNNVKNYLEINEKELISDLHNEYLYF